MTKPSAEWIAGAQWIAVQRPEVEAVEWYDNESLADWWYPIVGGAAMSGENTSVLARDPSGLLEMGPLGHSASGTLRYTRDELAALEATPVGLEQKSGGEGADPPLCIRCGNGHNDPLTDRCDYCGTTARQIRQLRAERAGPGCSSCGRPGLACPNAETLAGCEEDRFFAEALDSRIATARAELDRPSGPHPANWPADSWIDAPDGGA